MFRQNYNEFTYTELEKSFLSHNVQTKQTKDGEIKVQFKNFLSHNVQTKLKTSLTTVKQTTPFYLTMFRQNCPY